MAFANIVRGVPLDAHHEYTGTLLTLLNPYALLGGLATLALFALHGAIFLALKTDGDVRVRADALAPRIGVPAVAARRRRSWSGRTVSGNGVDGRSPVAGRRGRARRPPCSSRSRGREGWAFLLTAVAIVAVTVDAVRIAVPRRAALDAPTRAYSLTIDQRVLDRRTR